MLVDCEVIGAEDDTSDDIAIDIHLDGRLHTTRPGGVDNGIPAFSFSFGESDELRTNT